MTIRRPVTLSSLLLLSLACATSRKNETATAAPAPVAQASVSSTSAASPGAPAAPSGPAFNPKEYITQFPHANTCEKAARDLQPQSRDHAWNTLRACINRGTFTLLREVVANWLPDLQTRKEAPLVLSRIIAARGGNIYNDLKLVHQQRIPLFSLGSAMNEPQSYKGKFVLVRAMISDIRNDGNKPTVQLAEYSLGTSESEVAVGPKSKRTSSYSGSNSGSISGSGSATVSTSNYGSGSAKAAYRVSGSSSSRRSYEDTSSTVETRYDNTSSETGREALGKLAKSDPFLVPEKELVILARFDGVRVTSESEEEETDEEGPRTIAVLTIIKYFDPNPMVVF